MTRVQNEKSPKAAAGELPWHQAHEAYCNGDKSKPVGDPGCSCRAGSIIRSLAATIRADTVEACAKDERRRIANALEEDGEMSPCREDGQVYISAAWLVRGDFSYEEAERLERTNERYNITERIRSLSTATPAAERGIADALDALVICADAYLAGECDKATFEEDVDRARAKLETFSPRGQREGGGE